MVALRLRDRLRHRRHRGRAPRCSAAARRFGRVLAAVRAWLRLRLRVLRRRFARLHCPRLRWRRILHWWLRDRWRL